jgi:hypothetical protein
VAVKITDPLVLAEIADILRSGREKWESGELTRVGQRSRMTPELGPIVCVANEHDENAEPYGVTVTPPFNVGSGPKPDSESSVS